MVGSSKPLCPSGIVMKWLSWHGCQILVSLIGRCRLHSLWWSICWTGLTEQLNSATQCKVWFICFVFACHDFFFFPTLCDSLPSACVPALILVWTWYHSWAATAKVTSLAWLLQTPLTPLLNHEWLTSCSPTEFNKTESTYRQEHVNCNSKSNNISSAAQGVLLYFKTLFFSCYELIRIIKVDTYGNWKEIMSIWSMMWLAWPSYSSWEQKICHQCPMDRH